MPNVMDGCVLDSDIPRASLRSRISGGAGKDSDRYKVANCTRAQPGFHRFGRLVRGKIIFVTVLTGRSRSETNRRGGPQWPTSPQTLRKTHHLGPVDVQSADDRSGPSTRHPREPEIPGGTPPSPVG